MKTKLVTAIVALFTLLNVYSQSDLNNYKYVIVPNKFDFLKQENQYRLNELAQFLFNKHGFKTVMEGTDYPEDLLFNSCLGLRSNVEKESGVFKTKLRVVLKDCNGKTVYASPLGESREKEYKVAYNEAMRVTFDHLRALNYQYVPKKEHQVAKTQKNEADNEIQRLKEEIKTLKKEKEIKQIKQPKAVVNKRPVTPQKQEVLQAKNVEPKTERALSNVLYAQATENGFQLVDSAPKVVFRIQKTGLSNVFLVEGKSSIIYRTDTGWVLEYYENGASKQQELNIKF
ncbi:hypothetical protein H7U19_04030 [Hyunsoonleella sp. SJ7]|uniref:Uncharacterized protein n=1 Tax=Hyunsoonleella aquatilis TaxID=2762758 RepID=A0A923H9L7_9FLAO|nr:hypothetical protein [Hyunsoonleella aquatilis]MBC3757557.1 hypothetical protein [Hyunsoonleella aquatilis]